MVGVAWLIYALLLLIEIVFASILIYHIQRFKLENDPVPGRALFIFLFIGIIILLGSLVLAGSYYYLIIKPL